MCEGDENVLDQLLYTLFMSVKDVRWKKKCNVCSILVVKVVCLEGVKREVKEWRQCE